MSEEGLIKQIEQSLEMGNYSFFIGVLLLLAVGSIRYVTIDRLQESWAAWTSVVSGVIASVASILIAGGKWYTAIIIGLFGGSVASQGFWKKVSTLIPKQDKKTITF